MGTRRSYADDLLDAHLPMPEDAMSRTVRVFGLELVPTQPRCLLQYRKGVYAHRLQFDVGLAGPPVDALFRDHVLTHLQASGCNVRKTDSYVSLLQNLCFTLAQAHADAVAYGVPVVVTFHKSRSAYTRQIGTSDAMPGFCVVDTLFRALDELGLAVVTPSTVDGQLSSIISTDNFLSFDQDLSPVILSRNGQVCVMSARAKVKGEKVPTGEMTKTGRRAMHTPVTKGGHQRIAMAKLVRAEQRFLQHESDKLTVANTLLSRCRLAFCDGKGRWHRYFAGNLLYRAVWNDGDTDHGGRNFCRGQNLPQRCMVPIRETLHMALEGQVMRALVEVDYKNLHIRMLYALVGDVLADDFDCYDIPSPGWPKCKAVRDFLKVLLLALPNCGNKNAAPEKNLQTAHAMARKQYRDWQGAAVENDPDGSLTRAQRAERRLPDGVTPATVIHAIVAAHRPIAEHLYTGKGLELQAVDGQIARNILYHFALKGVPVVCIHDSFMILPDYADELRALMVSEYRAQMQASYPDLYDGSAPVPELKDKKRKCLQPIPADLYESIANRTVPRNEDAVLAIAAAAPAAADSVMVEAATVKPAAFEAAAVHPAVVSHAIVVVPPAAEVLPRARLASPNPGVLQVTTSVLPAGAGRLFSRFGAFDPSLERHLASRGTTLSALIMRSVTAYTAEPPSGASDV